MDKMRMESVDLTQKNIEKIYELFPSVVTEKRGADGHIKKAVNFELLKQILAGEVVEGDEAYEFTWVGKKEAMAEAGRSIRKTLRPCKEESKNWDNTENLYIEGDNLDVLKLLQESYLGEVKVIFIDPPYNTGNDFVYKDNFKQTSQGYDEKIGIFDEENNKLFQNTESNGRFHSDWCSMIYSRLLCAKNLLSSDGVIFISIDDNEFENMKKICNEVFGEENFTAQFIWTKTSTPPSLSNKCRKTVEYLLCYEKKKSNSKYFGTFLDNGDAPLLNTGNAKKAILFPKNSIKITYFNEGIIPAGNYEKVSLLDDMIVKNNENVNDVHITGEFKWGQETVNEEIKRGTYFIIKSTKLSVRFQRVDLGNYKTPNNFLNIELNKENDVLTNEQAVSELKELGLDTYFNYPKPISLIKKLVNMVTYNNADAIVMDFFSGSATTAHAVMQLNSEDNGHRKFIMVQLPELTETESKAYKDGYRNICEIGKERIRRAGDKIIDENKGEDGLDKLDVGFRVFKLDDSNMKDVYYSAEEYTQATLDDFLSNIKEDRTDLDLLYGCLLDWGLSLSLPYNSEKYRDAIIHTVNEGDLIACFDSEINEEIVREIAKRQPLRVVFRDSSFENSPAKINVEEIFKLLAPNTRVKVI